MSKKSPEIGRFVFLDFLCVNVKNKPKNDIPAFIEHSKMSPVVLSLTACYADGKLKVDPFHSAAAFEKKVPPKATASEDFFVILHPK
ncbi:MAG: hypothetical protein IKP84_08665 [Prevotella sp.]|nr:hypothetical protein [Prevotella sp.]